MIKSEKVLDITDLPKGIKTHAYVKFKEYISGNDSFFRYNVQPMRHDNGNLNEDYDVTLDAYLLEQGLKAYESILILYCW